jgi:predicted ATPase
MIKELSLGNFKCFDRVTIPFRNLTLLTGLNGMGKSSVLQALLLLRQSHLSGDLAAGRLLLAGDLTTVGTGADALFEGADDDIVRLSLTFEEPNSQGASCSFAYLYDKKVDRLAAVDPPGALDPALQVILETMPPFAGHFSYIEAERLGPRRLLQMSDSRAMRLDVGTKGEYVLHVLLEHGESLVGDQDPRIKGGPSNRLLDQVEAWLQEISPGAHLDVVAIRNADAALAGYRFDRQGDVLSRTFRSTNVGFGLSYALPVIVALLVAPRDSMVIIENPEAHLHPQGQTRLGQLAARAAAAGVQVIAETHSDHFLDGVRIDVSQSILPWDRAVFHYFSRVDGASVVESPSIDAAGRLSSWPAGFFDQHDHNLAELIARETKADP